MSYGLGASFSGTEFTDEVTLAPGLVVSGQSIGVASKVSPLIVTHFQKNKIVDNILFSPLASAVSTVSLGMIS